MRKSAIIKIVALLGVAAVLAAVAIFFGCAGSSPSQDLNKNWYQNLDWQKIGEIGNKATTTPEVINSGITGSVLLGPTCPVERIPPDPQCADRPYQGDFVVTPSGGVQVIAKFSSGADGKFKIALKPGEYIIRQSDTTKILPRCPDTGTIKVEEGKFANADISCDTGIR